jgi:hypothetical protein
MKKIFFGFHTGRRMRRMRRRRRRRRRKKQKKHIIVGDIQSV